MEAILLAGGFGTRLAARLSGVPKPMAPIAGRPFLEILLRQLSRCGTTHAVLSVGYLHEVIRQHFGARFEGIRLDYAVEEAPLGTGGAIRFALEQASEDEVLVLNGDTFLQADYAEMMRFHLQQKASMTIAVARQEDIARYGGVVVAANRVTGFEEKGRSGPGWINAGAYVINRGMEWPPQCSGRFSFEKDLLGPLVGKLKPAAYRVDGYFLDIGVPEDFDRAQSTLAGL